MATSLELGPEVGRGATSTVFDATLNGVRVALKVGRQDSAATFVAEAMACALPIAPRLPRLVDVGWVVGQDQSWRVDVHHPGACPFLALRWTGGRSLREAWQQRELEATSVAADLTNALSDLHGLGLAHGDIKADNVLIDDEGRASLIDLGMSGPIHRLKLEGATPRYLATGDMQLGDAGARDKLALGALMGELLSAELRQSAALVQDARACAAPGPVGAVMRAMLAPDPSARPSLYWAAHTLGVAAGDAGWAQRKVRASYLRVRQGELLTATDVHPEAAQWLAEAVRVSRQVRTLVPTADDADRTLAPLTEEGLQRWMVLLCGAAAASWPVTPMMKMSEHQVAVALWSAAALKRPDAWTYADLERALTHEDTPPPLGLDDRSSSDRMCIAALGVSASPPSEDCVSWVEAQPSVPLPLLIKTAQALRLGGQYGRARSLITRPNLPAHPSLLGVRADIHRRAGDLELASADAAAASETGSSIGRATLARLAFDRGAYEEALRLCANDRSAEVGEVRALALAGRGQQSEALRETERALAVADTSEARARVLGVRGYIAKRGLPEEALSAFRSAVQDAVRVGAVVEEATYLTGVASAAVDLGLIAIALESSQRAALLWEHLGRPSMSARALLASSAAHATLGARNEAVLWAERAISRARDGEDLAAEAYAQWAICDTAPPGDDSGIEAAESAAHKLGTGESEVRVRSSARLLKHGVLAASQVSSMDDLASEPHISTEARFEWWGARAIRLKLSLEHPGETVERPDRVLSALSALAGTTAAIGARATALNHGFDLARASGNGEVARRLRAALGDLARAFLSRLTEPYLSAARQLPWVAHGLSEPTGRLSEDQVSDLEALVHSLGDREKLSALMVRVVDALVLWTGVERGLLLMCAPDGRLIPRAARNLARSDLHGEQLTLSQTLARRALDARKPVVAVDASGELPLTHQSVHALKLRSVLAVPLIARGDALGVVYLDDRARVGAFGTDELAWTRTIAALAATMIADARDRVLLRRAARKARRATERLAETLANREVALELAERKLAETTSRGTRFRYDHIIGESEAMRSLLQTVDRVSAADVPVLIGGESGSGKELIARAIHENSERGKQAFVSENCGAVPEGLIESNFFGHVRGAFTGADRPRVGLIEAAHMGTLFLDEIGEMSLGMQAKMLRVLEDGIIRPLGTERTRRVSVRLITATHRDLAKMVDQGTFREDLYYRLNIITLKIPPLRERPKDIPLLVEHFIRKHSGEKHAPRRGGPAGQSPKPAPTITVEREVMDALVAYPWPGNARQLENEIRRALVLCDDVIQTKHLSETLSQSEQVSMAALGLNVRGRVDALETALVGEALTRTQGNLTQAAKLLGLSRFGLQKMVKRLGIDPSR